MGDDPAQCERPASPFERFTNGDVRDLLAEHPLAWVASRDGGAASLLPLLGEYDEGGTLVSLLGHMARRNALHAELTALPRALILFTGPQGYVSPAQAERANWGPTWNYAQLTIEAEVTFLPDEADTALASLVSAMEGTRWTSSELGPRYAGMAGAIIAFRARVIALSGRFKLGQDEDQVVRDAILRNHPDAGLVRWMRRSAMREEAG